jgi:hypothetical protein
MEPSPLSLGGGEDMRLQNRYATSTCTHLISPSDDQLSSLSSVQTDTHDAALLLASIKKLAVKEAISLDSSKMPSMPNLTPREHTMPEIANVYQVPSSLNNLFPALEVVFKHKNDLEGTSTHVRETRARTVSVDSHSFSSSFIESDPTCDPTGSSFRTDALPRDRICLDLTSDQNGGRDSTKGSLVAKVSPPSSPMLQSYKASKQKGPQGISKKKRQLENLTTSAESNQKRKKLKARPSILRSKEVQPKNMNNKKILRKKFSWKSYPELEDFLIANREEYLRHSAMNYTMQQKEYNNRLTERLLELASECGYIFDEESFSFVSIRDRIRCYFKSYVQSKKKRGLILGYAARRKGLISEEELEKSAGIKGTIIVPKKSNQKKTKLPL